MSSNSKKNSFSKQSEKQYLKVTLNSLKLKSTMLADKNVYNTINLQNVLIFSPNCESKFAAPFKGFPKNKIDIAIKEIFASCNIDYVNYYKYASCKAGNTKKININSEFEEALKARNQIAIIQNKNGILKSFYTGLRNSVAHGNVLFNNGFYYFYSVNKGLKKESEEDKTISFLLIIKDVSVIDFVVERILKMAPYKKT